MKHLQFGLETTGKYLSLGSLGETLAGLHKPGKEAPFRVRVRRALETLETLAKIIARRLGEKSKD